MKKIIIIAIGILVLLGGILGYPYYKKYKGNNVAKEGYVLIPRNAKLEQVMDSIKPYLSNAEDFREVALDKNMEKKKKAGR